MGRLTAVAKNTHVVGIIRYYHLSLHIIYIYCHTIITIYIIVVFMPKYMMPANITTIVYHYHDSRTSPTHGQSFPSPSPRRWLVGLAALAFPNLGFGGHLEGCSVGKTTEAGEAQKHSTNKTPKKTRLNRAGKGILHLFRKITTQKNMMELYDLQHFRCLIRS